MNAAVSADATLRRARIGDLPAIVRMLADDPQGSRRERFAEPLPDGYAAAFAAIDADPNQELWVADRDGAAVATLQLSFIPGLTYQGGWRALIEAVRVDAGERGRGLGERLVRHAIERARQRDAVLVQLTTHKSRVDAHRFYARLGFVASHEGMKLPLR